MNYFTECSSLDVQQHQLQLELETGLNVFDFPIRKRTRSPCWLHYRLLQLSVEELGAKPAKVTILDHPSQNLKTIYFPKYHIPQATDIPYQPLLIKPIFSVLAHAEKQFFSKLVFECLSTFLQCFSGPSNYGHYM